MTKTLKNLYGWGVILLVWVVISYLNLIPNSVLPTPGKTLTAFIQLFTEDDVLKEIWFSVKLNLIGYAESILLALPIGFLLGTFKTTRHMFSHPIDSLRFVPISALGGIFIAISGLTIWTKIHFLAFGIWVYLVPVIVQRIDEVNKFQLQMMQTLRATRWQIFKHVIWPSVISRLSDDIRILVGISWTYIIIAELKNIQGGLGSMIFLGEKQSKPEIVYSILVIIILLGVFQDKLFKFIDSKLYKFKYS